MTVALVVGAVPFIVQWRTTVASEVDGVLTVSSRDPVALVAGGLAALLAIAALFLFARRAGGGRHPLAWIAGVAALGLGGYHVASGLGAFVDAPASPPRIALGHPTPPVAPAPPAAPKPQWVCDVEQLTGCVTGCELDRDPIACGLASAYLGGLGDREPDFERARAFARRACDQGEPVGCGNLGAFYLQGDGGPADALKASGYFAKACRAGAEGRCVVSLRVRAQEVGAIPDATVSELLEVGCPDDELGACLDAARELVRADLVPLAGQVLDWLCERDQSEACNERGRLYDDVGDGARDRDAANRLYDRGCDLGSVNACVNRALGAIHEDPPDHGTARARLAEVCAGPVASFCLRLALARRDAFEVYALALSLCENDYPLGCSEAGRALLVGRAPTDAQRVEAAALFERACVAGEPLGCRNLGAYHLGEFGGEPEPDAAWPWLSRACAPGDEGETPCADLARALKGGGQLILARRLAKQGCDRAHEGEACAVLPFTRPNDMVDHAEFLDSGRRACELQSGLGCQNLGFAHLEGRFGAERDVPRALELFEAACRLDSVGGCAELADIHGEGLHGVDPDPGLALRFNRRACELGVTERCEVPAPAPGGGD